MFPLLFVKLKTIYIFQWYFPFFHTHYGWAIAQMRLRFRIYNSPCIFSSHKPAPCSARFSRIYKSFVSEMVLINVLYSVRISHAYTLSFYNMVNKDIVHNKSSLRFCSRSSVSSSHLAHKHTYSLRLPLDRIVGQNVQSHLRPVSVQGRRHRPDVQPVRARLPAESLTHCAVHK